MCRGREQSEKRRFDLNKPVILDEAELDVDTTCRTISCELCGSKASLYCQADDAFLCRKCDEWVHGANFLAHRHVRSMLCDRCQNLTHRYLVGTLHEIVVPSIIMKWRETRSTNRHAEYCGSNNDETRCTRSLKRPFEFI